MLGRATATPPPPHTPTPPLKTTTKRRWNKLPVHHKHLWLLSSFSMAATQVMCIYYILSLILFWFWLDDYLFFACFVIGSPVFGSASVLIYTIVCFFCHQLKLHSSTSKVNAFVLSEFILPHQGKSE